MEDVSTLRDLVLRRRAELGHSGRPLSNRDTASRSGGRLSHATVGNISNGRHVGEVSDRIIDGLAIALDLPRSQILTAIGRSYLTEATPFTVPKQWDRLNETQRRVLYTVGEGLLSSFEAGRLSMDHLTPGGSGTGASPGNLRAVARNGKSTDAERVAEIARRVRKNQTST